jgi:membrane protein implicated in regulation of membrane protease activity
MNDQPHESPGAPTTAELAEYGLAASTGLGILTMALAPLAIPFLVLTAVFALPLLLPVLALGLIGSIVAVPVLLVRRLARRRRSDSGQLRHQVAATGGRPT